MTKMIDDTKPINVSKLSRKDRERVRLQKLEIVSHLYKRGYSYRQIRTEVMTRLALVAYSLADVKKDVYTLLDEWRSFRIEDMDASLQLELERIDDTCQELWRQWEKSKEDYFRTTNIKRGVPKKKSDTGSQGQKGKTEIETQGMEEMKTNVVGLGDPRYIAEIRAQLAERRKLLGLYAPEKKEINDTSFAAYLMESGLIDEAEAQMKGEASQSETTKN